MLESSAVLGGTLTTVGTARAAKRELKGVSYIHKTGEIRGDASATIAPTQAKLEGALTLEDELFSLSAPHKMEASPDGVTQKYVQEFSSGGGHPERLTILESKQRGVTGYYQESPFVPRIGFLLLSEQNGGRKAARDWVKKLVQR